MFRCTAPYCAPGADWRVTVRRCGCGATGCWARFALTIYNVAAGALWLVGVRRGAELGRAYRTAEHVAGYVGLTLLAALVVVTAAALVQRHGRRHRAWPV